MSCIYHTDINTFVFNLAGSTETIAVSIVNSIANETYDTV